MRAAVIAVLAGLLAACTDFPTPAELEKPTILAITADPPIVPAGGQARLETVIADGSGVLTSLAPSYRLIETYAGIAPLGRLEKDAIGTHYVAPDPVPSLPGNAPPIDSVEVTVETPAERIMAIKVMGIGPVATANPAITGFTVGDGDALAGPLTVRRGETRAIQVVCDPAMSTDARYAWYTVAGTIEQYQSNPAELVVDDGAQSGWLFVVVRDGHGGVAWRGVELRVE